MKKSFSFLALLGMLIPLNACGNRVSVNNTPVAKLDLNRYLGSWYEIARFDHSFERGRDNCTAYYSLNGDGSIRVENMGWKGDKKRVNVGRAKTTSVPALLRVSFFGPFYGDYRVMMLADDYSVALIGGSTDEYLWILSRTPTLSEATKNAVLTEAAHRGYDTTKLIWVDQSRYIK